MPYQHLSEQERYSICHMNMAGRGPTEIARTLGRSPGTITRELQRNRIPEQLGGNYFYDDAQRQARERRCRANEKRRRIDSHSRLGDYVRDALRQHWSPEEIAGRLMTDHPDDTDMWITHEAIYQWVYRQERGAKWYQYLRRKRIKRRRRGSRAKRGQIIDRVGIEERPKIVEKRSRFGDWESDTVEGAKGRGGLATHAERKSRFLIARRLDDKRADTYARRTLAGFGGMPEQLCKTMTCDNGKEFAAFKKVEKKLGLKVYFADPYAPWQRGTNENTNGLLREFFPKGTDFRKISHHAIAKAVSMLNNRPRKCLNYRTPAEVLSVIPGVALRN